MDIATINPFRYRGYYYDEDIGLYYLKTRYYDSNTGRFINADSYVSTGQGLTGCNMYAYCNNNPVMYVDPTGELSLCGAIALLTVTVVAVISVATVIGANHCVNKANEKKIDEELADSYTKEEAEAAINNYLNTRYGEDVNASIGESGNLSITNSYKVNSRYDRMYASTIYARTEVCQQSSGTLSAEWMAHNILNFPFISEHTAHVNLEAKGDKYVIVRVGAKILAGLGVR